MIDRQNEYGRWVPSDPLPDPFGVRWERAIRIRRALRQGWLRAIVGGFVTTRRVDKLADYDWDRYESEQAG